jgi:hypothetical protein
MLDGKASAPFATRDRKTLRGRMPQTTRNNVHTYAGTPALAEFHNQIAHAGRNWHTDEHNDKH